jgi:nicotinic acid mononucleotide adenylyltransferase
MFKVLAHVPELQESSAAKIGVETLLSLWEESKEKHPYMFFMGTDFRKLKAPLFWYDILHVLDVLSLFAWARKDKRFQQMLKTVESKANPEGQFVPESVWTAWKDWDFSQKKVPSRGLTFFVARILKRASES